MLLNQREIANVLICISVGGVLSFFLVFAGDCVCGEVGGGGVIDMWVLHLRLSLTLQYAANISQGSRLFWCHMRVCLNEHFYRTTTQGPLHMLFKSCQLGRGGGGCVWAFKVVSSVTGKPINSVKNNNIKTDHVIRFAYFLKINNK